MNEKLRLGISECLLGHNVRYDGQHKYDAFLVETLGRFVEYVPVCPEVECGLGVPRESMRLVGDPESPRLVTTRTGRDLTDQMMRWVHKRVKELAKENLCGFIFKSKSPSSGMERVKVYTENGGIAGSSAGMFAREFMRAFPLLPTEEEGRLHDVALRENFIERIFTLNRYRLGPVAERTPKALMRFQATHKYLLMAHSAKHTEELGRIAAAATRSSMAASLSAYEVLLLRALKMQATQAKQTNVLQHMQGYFKKDLSHDEKAEMTEVVMQYKAGLVPLVVPVTLVKHYARKYGVDYLADQVYLNPHPVELKLRNHA